MDGVRGVPSAIANVLPYTEIVLDTGVVVRSDWAAAEVAALADAELLAEAVKTSADDEANAQWNASAPSIPPPYVDHAVKFVLEDRRALPHDITLMSAPEDPPVWDVGWCKLVFETVSGRGGVNTVKVTLRDWRS